VQGLSDSPAVVMAAITVGMGELDVSGGRWRERAGEGGIGAEKREVRAEAWAN
jgi:hypothetical protein